MKTKITFYLLVCVLALDCDLTQADNERPIPNVTVVNLNLFHGFDCDPAFPKKGDQCRLAERVDLLFEHLARIGCPDIVTLQEIVDVKFVQRGETDIVGPLDSARDLVEAKLKPFTEVCGFEYKLLFLPFQGIDEELILSRYKIQRSKLRLLHSALFQPDGEFQLFARHAMHARIKHPSGPIDVFTTHLSSPDDFAENSCDSLALGFLFVPCPEECDRAGTVRECQARQLAQFVEKRHRVPNPAVITGDFNAEPGTTEYLEFTERGWVDTHLAAGKPECDRETSIGCTAGRDGPAGDLESPKPNVDSRIDYIFVVSPAPRGAKCAGIIGAATGIFAGKLNPFAETCGPIPDEICWASDHNGNRLNLVCDKSRTGKLRH
jgi:endonuclease/exonuclease/phosphatase family metal-dependent hydrolase